VTKIDRLGRSLIHFLQIEKEMERRGITIMALDQPIDTRGPMGKFIMAILAAAAEFELNLIRERTREGLQRARAEGKRLGRPPIPNRVKKRIIRLRERGLSYKRIAEEVGVSKRTVIRVVKGVQNPPSPEERASAIGTEGKEGEGAETTVLGT